jgi:hypothetical protein
MARPEGHRPSGRIQATFSRDALALHSRDAKRQRSDPFLHWERSNLVAAPFW